MDMRFIQKMYALNIDYDNHSLIVKFGHKKTWNK